MIQGGRLDDIARVVDDAFIFSNRSSGRSLRKWLDRLSRRLVLYGDFLDHFTQQHPEYPAFFWGALRVVVLVSCNAHGYLMYSQSFREWSTTKRSSLSWQEQWAT